MNPDDVNALTALAQMLGNQAEQRSADLLLQQINQAALLAQVLYLTQQVAAFGAQAALTGLRLAANQVALEAQINNKPTPKQSSAASVARFGLMGTSGCAGEQTPSSSSAALR